MSSTVSTRSLLCLLWLLPLGCSGTQETDRFELTGSITYLGKPVPAGYILFAPDEDKGNKGPGSSANISNGQYTTASGQGILGGPYIVRIFGSDGKPYPIPGDPGKNVNPNGKPLFPEIQLRIDFPRNSGSHDFTLPVKP